jgi:hemoglobin
MDVRKDIQGREDIVLLVDRFYEKVQGDPMLAPIFGHVNWPEHLPTMYNFWASMMLGEQSYQGNPFQKHLPLAIQSTHFDRWLALFTLTVRENFNGARADEILERANQIANVFQYKMGLTERRGE